VIKVRDENYLLHQYVIQLKPKRNFNKSVHSKKYIDHLTDLNGRKKIKILPWDENPYSVISGSELIVSIPFTSAAYIGIELGVQTIFYFPYQRQLLNPIYEHIIPVVYGKPDLTKYITKILGTSSI
jgi:polysaccharide biosynthesis PFTS motif protein